MVSKERYFVTVEPTRFGFKSSVGKETRVEFPMGDTDRWMRWSPEPSYWRPTKAWAIRVASRKRLKLEADYARRQQKEVVDVKSAKNFEQCKYQQKHNGTWYRCNFASHPGNVHDLVLR